ncbi:MAG: hypothetical protein JXA17_06215 [Dehalococcoidales bacterium]|nr:hypothetical protein [Dehalococcoidales bacterium]
MFLLFMLFGLIFLISGGIGLFYTNTNLVAWSTMWVFGNLTFGTFALFGVLILFFLAFFNAELDR